MAILLSSLLAIHAIRAFVSARILDDDQFREFKDKGLMGTLLNDPSKAVWEYRFIRAALRVSDHPRSKTTLLVWRVCCGAFVGGIVAFLLWLLFTIFQGA